MPIRYEYMVMEAIGAFDAMSAAKELSALAMGGWEPIEPRVIITTRRQGSGKMPPNVHVRVVTGADMDAPIVGELATEPHRAAGLILRRPLP